MSFEQKKRAALAELEASGIWRMNAMPPAYRLFWKLGFNVRPPHYKSFWQNAVSLGVYFACAWGLVMWFWQFRAIGMSFGYVAGMAAVAGVWVGAIMGIYYRWSARKHRLSRWSDLAPEAA